MRSIRAVPTVYTPSRALEWHCALSALGFGVILALPGRTFTTADLWDRFASVMPESSWATLMLSVAAVRIMALTVNGHWRRTPILRAMTAAVGAAVWGCIAALLFDPHAAGIQTGVGTYLVLCLSDVRSAYRAGRDVEIAARVAAMMNAAPPAPLPRGFAP